MKRETCVTFLFILACAISTPLLAAETPPDPEAWYRVSYASLWSDMPGDRVDAMVEHYAAEVAAHRADGSVERSSADDFVRPSVAEWLEEGWLRSELVGLETDRINASTATFKAKWLDHYEGGETDFACGWYLADFMDGEWRFTAYADLDCLAHGL